MDWKSYDEYNFRKRQEVLDAKKRDEEQRARLKEEGMRAWQHLLDIIQGGQPSRNLDYSPEQRPGMLYENPNGYVHNKELDALLASQPKWENPLNSAPSVSIPAPSLPGTLDEMPPVMRPGYDRLYKLYAPLFTEKEMPSISGIPQGPGMLKIADNTGGMNPIMQVIRREQLRQMMQSQHPYAPPASDILSPELQESNAWHDKFSRDMVKPQQPPNPEMNWLEDLMNKWQEGAGAPRPQPYDPRRYNPRGYDNYPGVNGQPVPNPNPAPRPQGSGVRG